MSTSPLHWPREVVARFSFRELLRLCKRADRDLGAIREGFNDMWKRVRVVIPR